MEAITDYIRFESKELGVCITISKEDEVWGFERTDGYSTWGSIDYKSFNQAYNEAKMSVRRAIDQDKLEKSYEA